MHYLMDSPYISPSYMTYLMGDEDEEGERGGGGGERGVGGGGRHNPISKQSIIHRLEPRQTLRTLI